MRRRKRPGSPARIIRPCDRKRTLSQTASISFMLWEVQSMPACVSHGVLLYLLPHPLGDAGVEEAVGSSKSKSLGLFITALARLRRLARPTKGGPLSCPAKSSRSNSWRREATFFLDLLHLVEQGEDVQVLPDRQVGGHVRVDGREVDLTADLRPVARRCLFPSTSIEPPVASGCRGPCLWS